MLPPRDLRIINKPAGTVYQWKQKKWSIFVPHAEYRRAEEINALNHAKHGLSYKSFGR